MKVLTGSVAAGLVVAVVLGLYLSGPSRKPSNESCPTSRAELAAVLCIPGENGRFVLAERTNAWERFKGAITGNP